MAMKKFSELSGAERVQLGMDFGHDVQGGCESPESRIERFFETKKMKQDIPALDDMSFCEGLDRIAECCEDCGWYVEPCQLNDYRVCFDCAPEEDEDE